MTLWLASHSDPRSHFWMCPSHGTEESECGQAGWWRKRVWRSAGKRLHHCVLMHYGWQWDRERWEGALLESGREHPDKQQTKTQSFIKVFRLLQLFHLPADIFRITRTDGDFTPIISVLLDMSNYLPPPISNDEVESVNEGLLLEQFTTDF